jgi:nucleotide-binding universal stress UspA family protein
VYRHILVGLNRSDAAHRALRRAISLAAAFNATVTAVAVVQGPSPYTAYAAALGPEALRAMESDQQTLYGDLIEMARKEAAQHSIEIETVLSNGPVVISLFEAVRTNDIDLLVLGIHSEHSVLGWLSGSTAHELAMGATCDILGVH